MSRMFSKWMIRCMQACSVTRAERAAQLLASDWPEGRVVDADWPRGISSVDASGPISCDRPSGQPISADHPFWTRARTLRRLDRLPGKGNPMGVGGLIKE